MKKYCNFRCRDCDGYGKPANLRLDGHTYRIPCKYRNSLRMQEHRECKEEWAKERRIKKEWDRYLLKMDLWC